MSGPLRLMCRLARGLWHGGQDRNVPVAASRYLARTLPSGRATFYANDAHLSVPLNHQAEILAALAAAMALHAA